VQLSNWKDLDVSTIKKDLVVYFATSNMDKPKLLYQECGENDKVNAGKVACMLSLVPTFTPKEPQDEIEIVENERPEEEELVYNEKIDKQLYFVFLVDRSGSMNGTKMEMTVSALVLFLQSLPPSCMFDIVSFGNKFESMS
jgi:uncharacterized protein with von Willebrand factor type A (vWA) domain